jgi:hypothetical protein
MHRRNMSGRIARAAAAGVLAILCASGQAGAVVMTVGGVTFDSDNATQTLDMISGTNLGGDIVITGYATDHGPGLWSGTSSDFPAPAVSLGTYVQRPTFQSG